MQFLGPFLGLFWVKWLQFSKHFPEYPKNTKIRILYPKKYDEHTYHITMKVPPRHLASGPDLHQPQFQRNSPVAGGGGGITTKRGSFQDQVILVNFGV